MTKTFLARLTAVAAPFVLALGLGSAPQLAGAQTPAAPQAAASAAAATSAPVAVPEKPAAPVAAPAATAKVDNPYGVGALWSQSDAVAKAVLAILAIMSMGSWYVIVTKLLEQMRMGRQARAVDNEFWNAGTVQAGTARLAEGSPFRFIADAGMQATQKHDGLRGKVDFADFVDLCIHRATERVQRRLGNGMSLLATVGSTAPFVGLFGTVWGIMNSFIGIAKTQTTNLAVVAPGIAEALLATALGLVAAIPAVVIYNVFARSIAGYKAQVSDASAEVLLLVSRDLDHLPTERSSQPHMVKVG